MRRANGTGTVVKLSGNRRNPYVVKVAGRDKYGQIIQVALSYHRTVAEAQAALEDYNTKKVQGRTAAIDKMSATVQMVYDTWSSRAYKKLGNASVISHKAAWNKRVSRFATRKIGKITLDDWQSILDEDEDKGLSQSLINNDAILIRALNAFAMKNDIIGKDYSAYLEVPSVDPKRPGDALNDLQVQKLEQLATDGVPWADTALILCYTGFRISEFLALTRFSYSPEFGGYLQGGLKTNSGKNRIVPVHPKIKIYLDRWIRKNGDTIFCGDNLKAISSMNYRVELFKPIMEMIDAPGATPHWCRHTFATRGHAAGIDETTLKWLLGHSTKGDITAHYTHETIEVLTRAIKLLA